LSQHDYVIDNQSAPSARADINAVLQAIATTNSGATAPVNTFANMLWYDTAANQLKKRNEADSAWLILGTIDDIGGTFTPNSLLTTAGIAPATLVTSGEGVAGNNNDSTIPTSAAVKAYADATAAAYAAGVTSATTANVLAATAGAGVGVVGSYALCYNNTALAGSGLTNPGTAVAGSNLRLSATDGTNTGVAQPAGSWRLMGYGFYGSTATPDGRKTSLWLRYA
jgi:hypothetical protein